ncbi:MAG: GNAT family N-acetyltransferase [Cellulosilyticaceae bacterium]
MNLNVRAILDNEKGELVRNGRKCFSLTEGMFLSKPKKGLVVEVDGEVVGAVFLKIITHKTTKIGYVDYIFIYPKFRGCGAAKLLYKSAIQALKDEGCTINTGVVVDDNAKSFMRFEAEGLYRTSSLDLLKSVGLTGLIKLNFLESGLGFGNSSAIYTDIPATKRPVAFSFALLLVVNAFLLCLSKLLNVASIGEFINSLIIIPAGLCVFLIGVLGSKLGSKIAGGNWVFHIPQGGILTSLIIALLGGFFPMRADFYPKKYDSSKSCTRGLAITALIEWSTILIINVASILTPSPSPFLHSFYYIGWVYFVFHVIPIYPFSSFGFRRVWDYNKVLCFIMMAASILVIILN